MTYTRLSRSLAAVLVIAMAMTGLSLGLPGSTADAQQTVTYTATQVIPVPPASNYQGTGGGDGWDVSLIDEKVYNVFHHNNVVVACHLESDASACWPNRTIIGPDGGFASANHSGTYMDQATGRMYTAARQSSDSSAGIVCIDTRSLTDDMFCGYTQLVQPGDASGGQISTVVENAGRLFSFNYFSGSEVVDDRNTLMCYELATASPCAGQPYTLDMGAGAMSTSTFPSPSVAAIGNQLIVPFETGSVDQLACFDMSVNGDCSGIWPVDAPTTYLAGQGGAGAPFPMLSANGDVTGLCLPTGNDDCYELTGDAKAAPAGLASAIRQSSPWNGEAVVLASRVYVPNGRLDDVDCYDFALGASCPGFPLEPTGLGLLYSVNEDPARPGCLWLNADNGAAQIQNFDAFGLGACGDGAIRVLTSASIVNTPLCDPASFESMRVVAPTPADYTSATVELLDGSGQSVGQPVQDLDANGEIDLTPFGLEVVSGLPQFLITIEGAAVQEVTVEFSWTGVPADECVGPDTVVEEPVVSTEVCDGKAVTIDLNLNGGDGTGTDGDDVFFGTPGNDVIMAGLGNDTVCAGDGSDVVYGDDGDDAIFGEDGIDYLYGGDGNDMINGGATLDIVFAGTGNDTIYGEGGGDYIWAQAGDDTIYGGSGPDRIFGGPQNDYIRGMGGQDRIWGEAGDDVIQGNQQSDRISGGDGNDELRGAGGLDIIYGDAGDDSMYGGANTDFLDGGDGVDFAHGQAGIDNPLVPGVSGCIAETQVSC